LDLRPELRLPRNLTSSKVARAGGAPYSFWRRCRNGASFHFGSAGERERRGGDSAPNRALYPDLNGNSGLDQLLQLFTICKERRDRSVTLHLAGKECIGQDRVGALDLDDDLRIV